MCVTFVNRNWELYGGVVEGEINPLDVSVKKFGKGNNSSMDKVLSEDRDDVIECNACDKAGNFKVKNGKKDVVDYVHKEGSVGESGLRLVLCERGSERDWKVLQNLLSREAK